MSFENSTFTSRAAARQNAQQETVETADTKAEQGDKAENKAVARKSTRTKKS